MNTTRVSLLECLRQRPGGQSWQRFVDLYQPWLRGQLRRYDLQTADTDDVVQEVMTVIVRELPNFRHNGCRGAFRTWLRGIMVNRLRELWRASKQHPKSGWDLVEKTLNQLSDDQSELTRIWDREHDQHIVSYLLSMIAKDFEPRTWQAFRAFVLEGRAASAVAADLGMSLGAIWTAKSHVLKRLREIAQGLLD